MRFFVRISQPAGILINLYAFRVSRKGKRHNPRITELFFHFGKINTPFIHSRRRSRLETAHRNTHFFQAVCQVICRLQSVRPGIGDGFSAQAACL